MRKTIMFLLLAFLASANVNAAEQAGASAQDKLDAQRLRSLLPKMLESSDISMTHDALVIIRSRLFRNEQLSDELLAKVQATLQRLLKTPKDSEAHTRGLACEVLGLFKSGKAIPVLLDALADRYVDFHFPRAWDGLSVQVETWTVWSKADHALREITLANPVAKPGGDYSNQNEVRKAWLEWYKKQPEKTKPDHPG